MKRKQGREEKEMYKGERVGGGGSGGQIIGSHLLLYTTGRHDGGIGECVSVSIAEDYRQRPSKYLDRVRQFIWCMRDRGTGWLWIRRKKKEEDKM